MIRTIAILCVAVVALDAVESATSRATGIPYAWFMVVQLVFYCGVGFVLRRRGAAPRAVALAALVASFVEATAGEWLAVAIGGSPATSLMMRLVVLPVVLGAYVAIALIGCSLGAIAFVRRERG